MREKLLPLVIRTLKWPAVVGWMGVIFGLSSLTGQQLAGSLIPAGWSSLGHFGEYAILGLLLLVALGSRDRAIAAIALASAYGITDELHQLFVPGRTSDPVDWLVDTAGAATGVFIAILIMRTIQVRRERQN
ncbi:MAG: VanZ family [Actinobacteria bacterium]|nr:MAG: VanZ family [Actinomycetota bacterium]